MARNGHSMEMMEELEPKATQRAIEMDIFGGHVKDRKSEASNKLIFSVKYFKELEELRKFVNSMEPYIKSAFRKHSTQPAGKRLCSNLAELE